MSDTLKGLIPNIFFFLANVVDLAAATLKYIATILVTISVNLHIQFGTKKGTKYREIQLQIQAATQAMMETYKRAMAQQMTNQTKDSKLANIVKASNVLTLGKKKDEPTES